MLLCGRPLGGLIANASGVAAEQRGLRIAHPSNLLKKGRAALFLNGRENGAIFAL